MADSYAQFQQQEIRKAALLAMWRRDYPYVNYFTVMAAGYPDDRELATERFNDAHRLMMIVRGLA